MNDPSRLPAQADEPRPNNPGLATLGRGRASWLAPLVIAHFLAYPVAFVAALSAIPPSLLLRKRALLDVGARGASSSLVRDVARDLALTPIEAAQLELVLEFVLGASVVVFVLVHLLSMPWLAASVRAARTADPELPALRRARRLFGWSAAGLVAALALAGAAGWLWLLTV